MFKKLLALIRSPKNRGISGSDIGGQHWSKTYDVVLANMEGTPTYPLSHQLTIGSEIGNIIINDESVSPRHATLILQDEVISIMDHGSVAGTFVNGTKIPPGKFIILEDADKLTLGDLELAIDVKVKASEIPTPPKHEELEDEEEEAVEEVEEVEQVEDEVENTRPEPSITKSKIYTQNLNAKKSPAKKKKIRLSYPTYEATNSIFRILALIGDFLLAQIILMVFTPFDDFRNFLSYIPTVVAEAGDFRWGDFWMIAKEEVPEVTEILGEVYLLLSEYVDVLPLLIVFFLIRFLTTILLGVSVSEFMFGVRANFHGIWARIGGGLRVILGMVTGPFLIFDLPALASKRTFKELLTFTNTFIGSRVTMFFGFILYMPLLILGILLAPMVIGLELVEPVPFTANVSQRVKPKPPAQPGAVEVQKKTVASRFLGISLSFDPEKLSPIPRFQFKGERSKLNLRAQLDLFRRDTERTVTLELYKTFDLKGLLHLGLKGNFLLHEQYQKLYNFAYAAEGIDRNFKAPADVKKEESFGKEFVKFTEMAMGLGPENLPDFMLTKTPFLRSVVDYRSSLLSLLENQNSPDLSVVKLGKILCIRAAFGSQKPYDLLIPILRGEGRIYKISYDRKEALPQVRNDFYKFTLDEMSWGGGDLAASAETLNAFEVIDFFTLSIQKETLSSERAQALYGYYFEKSAEVLKAGKPLEFELWKNSVKSVANAIPHLQEMPAPEGDPAAPVESVKKKLESNFNDLMNALENKNNSFFGIEESPTV